MEQVPWSKTGGVLLHSYADFTAMIAVPLTVSVTCWPAWTFWIVYQSLKLRPVELPPVVTVVGSTGGEAVYHVPFSLMATTEVPPWMYEETAWTVPVTVVVMVVVVVTSPLKY